MWLYLGLSDMITGKDILMQLLMYVFMLAR